MNFAWGEGLFAKAKFFGMRAYPGECGLGGFLHDIAQLAREAEANPLATAIAGGLNEEDIAAVGSHCEANGHAWNRDFFRSLGKVGRCAEGLGYEVGVDGDDEFAVL